MSEPEDNDPLAELSRIVFRLPPDAHLDEILKGAIHTFEASRHTQQLTFSLDELLANELERVLAEQ